MNLVINRRVFLRGSAALGAVAGARLLQMPYLRAAGATGDKLRTVLIGCGGQGVGNHIPPAVREHLVALVDPDDARLAFALKKVHATEPEVDAAKIRTFSDYRKLFDTMGKDIDALFIATPNHQHALPALLAMQRGIHVYVEKPMCHTIYEGRQMAEWARRYKVVTQMGNQGHSGEGYRRLCEYIWAGAIGKVTEVHSWTNRANGGIGPRPPSLPVPAGMHWDEWLGPAPRRDFHADLHPHEWHGWHDFGDGSPGNMACHLLDGACWALKLDAPTTVEVEEAVGGSDERYPLGTRIRFDFPARGDMPPVKIFWYDGQRKNFPIPPPRDPVEPKYGIAREACNRPPLAEELEKKYNIDLGSHGSLYVGDKGYMYTEMYGGGVRIIPEAQHQATPMPAKLIPRIKGSHQGDFLRACRGGAPACANFDYSVRLTEIVLLASLATIAGAGRKLEWDGPRMQCTNLPELNRFLKREPRAGWAV